MMNDMPLPTQLTVNNETDQRKTFNNTAIHGCLHTLSRTIQKVRVRHRGPERLEAIQHSKTSFRFLLTCSLFSPVATETRYRNECR
jgi:hypothetical protein